MCPLKLGIKMKKMLEFIGADASRVSGQAEKFWEITQEGETLTIRLGRIGINGQTTVKTLPSAAEAETEFAKLVSSKVKKGYVEVPLS
jgi:predicted DNA-binding WGR domain protein